MLKIIGSLTSPYSRITRVICEEFCFPYEFEITPPFSKLEEKDNKLINAHNPVMRVPILIDGGAEVLDSQVIVRYLLKRAPKNIDFRTSYPRDAIEENILTVIYGIMEAGILRFVLKSSHPEINADTGYMARSLERIETGLKWLNKQSNWGNSFGVPENALICGLDWFEKRNIFPWKEFSNITKIHTAYSDRPSLIKTRIPENI